MQTIVYTAAGAHAAADIVTVSCGIYARAPAVMFLGILEPVRFRGERACVDEPAHADAWPAAGLCVCFALFVLWVTALYFFPLRV